MKKKSVMLTMLLCTAMLATSCGNNGNSGTTSVKQENQKEESKKESDTGKEKSEVVIGFSREGDSFDPCTGFGYTGSPLYSTLIKVNGDDKLVNDLATEYKVSDDALTWTFKIRDDVKFTNGDTLKASDVAFTFQTAKEKVTYMDLTMMESCTAVDDTTVEFQLNKPCVTLAIQLPRWELFRKRHIQINLDFLRIRLLAQVLTKWCSGIKGSNLFWKQMKITMEQNPRFKEQCS